MARRKKRRTRSLDQKASTRKQGIFNPALQGSVSLKRRSEGTPEEPKKQEPPQHPVEHDETQHFLEAMSDVTPLSGDKKTFTPTPNLNLRPAHPVKNDELNGVAQLCDLVSGIAEMDITFSDEYIEGSVHGLGPKLMEQLRKGQFPVQDYLDLHGLTKQEAEVRVRDFLLQSHRLGLRCVLVVHGRGLNSENHIPVLKERLPVWLSRGPTRRIVLAFSTARPYDGGTGAIYILLRKRKGVA